MGKASAFKIAVKGEWKKKDILAKQHQLETLRRQCHEQLSVIVRYVYTYIWYPVFP